MRFLVIGASGFVGRNCLSYLKSHGFEAIGTQSRPRSKELVTFNLLEHRIGDCVDQSFFSREGQAYVVISAVISDMDRCLTEKELSYKVNVEKTIELIKDADALGAKIIFLSSCFVFDGTIGYYNEDHPISPANEYGRHKVAVENYLLKNVQSSFIARLDKIVGDSPYDPQLLAYWYKHMLSGNQIVCWEGSLLSPTYVIDLAKGIVLACEKKLEGVYHVSNSEFFYRDELARQFSYAFGKTPNVANKPLREFNFADKRGLKCYLDGSRFMKTTGLRFTSMREVFAAFKRNAGSVAN
jgi:dTDP-4-dehydrorhamnose reductase